MVLGGITISTVDSLRFLGIKITNKGDILPWRTDFTSSMYGITGRLKAAGLGNLPRALVSGLLLKVFPALLYGGEAWGVLWLSQVVRTGDSPYKWSRLAVVIDFLKQ